MSKITLPGRPAPKAPSFQRPKPAPAPPRAAPVAPPPRVVAAPAKPLKKNTSYNPTLGDYRSARAVK